MAKNLVGAGLADEVVVQLAYAIGVADPVSILIDTHSVLGDTHSVQGDTPGMRDIPGGVGPGELWASPS